MAEFKVLNDWDHAAALERGKQVYASPRAVSARLDRKSRRVVVRLDTGVDLAFDPKHERSLASAKLDDLEEIIIEGVGSTIRFPALDVDLTVANLPEFPGHSR